MENNLPDLYENLPDLYENQDNQDLNLPTIVFLHRSDIQDDIYFNYLALLNERHDFEINMYDFLVTPIIPDSFWEPVKVSFDGVRELGDIIGKDICSICTYSRLNFKNVNCCNQKICNGCCYKWFNESVKCPYCFQDLREFNLKNST